MDAQNTPNLQRAYHMIETYLDGISLDESALRRYLTVQGHVPLCSVSNGILMTAQRPNVTQYKTREAWEQDHVSIQPEQREILMLIPNGTYTRSDGKVCTKFDTQAVFDISGKPAQVQTENIPVQTD